MNVFLLGFMGSGKTTVGRKLARELSLPFTDLDAAIEVREGRTVTEIFEQSGEAAFRESEARALAKVLESNGQVLALGGGTP
ncbi:MAG: shikimate kinase, partial [Bacteroidota bacterium]